MGRPIGRDAHLCSPWPRSAAGLGSQTLEQNPARGAEPLLAARGRPRQGARTKGRGRAGLQAAEGPAPWSLFP